MSAAKRKASPKDALARLRRAFDRLVVWTGALRDHAGRAGDDVSVRGYDLAVGELERILFGRSGADAQVDPVSAHAVPVEGSGRKAWLLCSSVEKDDETGLPLYWSNVDGWGCMSTATRFADHEVRARIKAKDPTPLEGYWVPVDL